MMHINAIPLRMFAFCTTCGSEVELNDHNRAPALRHGIMCAECRRKPAPGRWNKQLYAEYLQTEHWQYMRKLALSRAGNRCQVCAKTERLEVHHNCYENLGGEPLVDLVVLCDGCHRLFHGVL